MSVLLFQIKSELILFYYQILTLISHSVYVNLKEKLS